MSDVNEDETRVHPTDFWYKGRPRDQTSIVSSVTDLGIRKTVFLRLSSRHR